jgi:hypothetical protein
MESLIALSFHFDFHRAVVGTDFNKEAFLSGPSGWRGLDYCCTIASPLGNAIGVAEEGPCEAVFYSHTENPSADRKGAAHI